MPDTPPPLPVADDSTARALAQEAARLAPPPAPLLWRTVAFSLDAVLFGLLGYWIITAILIPEYHPENLTVFRTWFDEIGTLYGGMIDAASAGNEAAMNSFNRALTDKMRDMPSGVQELFAYASVSMTVVLWIGFSLSELLTGGASLGKRMCRLRVASFPYAGKPGLFDTLLRSWWKAMGLATMNPLALLFAVVDAHAPLFNPLRRSLHDYLSRTVVLDARFDPPEQPKADDEDEDDEDQE